MKNSEKFEKAFNYFKKSYRYKMGGSQTVVLPNGKSKFFDDRVYYSGRGTKYNSNIQHDEIGMVKISKKDYSSFLKILKDREQAKIKRIKEARLKEARIEEAKSKGIYTIDSENFVELSEKEQHSCTFDVERLANTLKISIEDASLLMSKGKTYVFAKSTDGKTYELYHPSLSCNSLSIHVEVATKDRIAQFNPKEWQSGPYAGLVGQTNNDNHFVC